MSTRGERREWIDGVKGLAILWIVFFHTFKEWDVAESTSAAWTAFSYVFRLAYHSVGVFFVMSGVGLALSLARGRPKNGWLGWYRSRVLRLFPMYWLAHLVIAVSPLATTWEPIDGRFALSLAGDRFWPVEDMFYYLNASWWYFGTLLQLYLLFPLLWLVLERFGPSTFLGLAAGLTVGVRYWLLVVHPVHGSYVQGAFAVCRLWEMAYGMVIGFVLAQAPRETEARLFAPSTLVAGFVVFGVGVLTSRSPATYAVTDALTGSGLFLILANAARFVLDRAPAVGRRVVLVGTFSYGLYLLHQPYVITLGTAMRGYGAVPFFAAAAVVIALLAVVTMQVERAMNAGVAKVLS